MQKTIQETLFLGHEFVRKLLFLLQQIKAHNVVSTLVIQIENVDLNDKSTFFYNCLKSKDFK